MKHFSRALSKLLDEKHLTQVALSQMTGLSQGKISRLLSDTIRADRADLDSLLAAFPERDDRRALLSSHVLDEVPADGLDALELEAHPQSSLQELAALDLRGLSERGERALRYLLALKRDIPAIEQVIIDLAVALGWDAAKPTVLYERAAKPSSSSPAAAGAVEALKKDLRAHRK